MTTHITSFIEVFSDFDGTISLEDTGCILIDAGFGADNRRALDAKILSQEMTLLEDTDLMWKAVSLTHTEGMELLRPIQIDPGFLKFHDYTLKYQIPFTVLSCGLDFIIQEYLTCVTIMANYGKVVKDKWLLTYRDDSPYTHDKSVRIKQAKQAFLNKSDKVAGQEHVIVFCGDGISDLSAAREAAILFARRILKSTAGNTKLFDTFDEVTATVQGLSEGSLTMAEASRQLVCEN
ncbi:hypothetical protein BGZ82_010330 [Podila clonocystis]|nr:hypothetical protein BGZ82_010330 [Podila clonocystis]